MPPLKFRTAGFPQYGFKAGLSDAAFRFVGKTEDYPESGLGKSKVISPHLTSGPESFSEYRSIDPAPALRFVCCVRNISML
jgi:hypothetical protein